MDVVDDVPGGDDGQLDQLLGAAAVGDDHVLGGAQRLHLAEDLPDLALVAVADPALDPVGDDVLVLLDEAGRRLAFWVRDASPRAAIARARGGRRGKISSRSLRYSSRSWSCLSLMSK